MYSTVVPGPATAMSHCQMIATLNPTHYPEETCSYWSGWARTVGWTDFFLSIIMLFPPNLDLVF